MRDAARSSAHSSERAFSRSSRNAELKAKGPFVSLGAAARILRSGDEVKAKVQAHHSKHASRWADRRATEMLKKSGNAPTLSLGGSDRQATMRTRARNEVAAKLANRLKLVERVQARMMESGKVRQSRKPQWSKGLGE